MNIQENAQYDAKHPGDPPRSFLDHAERRVIAIVGDSQVGLATLRSLAKNGLTVYAVCNSDQGQAAHSRYCAGAWVLNRGPEAPPPAEQVERLAK